MVKKYVFALFAALLFCTLDLHAGQVIDRIVASVNGHIILQSDWDDAVRCEAVMNGIPLNEVTLQKRKEVLDRMIDQELLREQIPSLEHPSVNDADVLHRLASIRQYYDTTGNDQLWVKTLAQYQVTEKDIKNKIVLEIELMDLVNSHLRPEVQIDQKSIESYYNHALLPQLQQSGSQQVPLAKAAPQIKEILTQQKMNQLLVAWLQNLRADSKIVTNPSGDQAQ